LRYAILIHERPGRYDGLDAAAFAAIADEFRTLREDPRVLDGARLQGVETATTVRLDGQRTLITDGPFADLKEVFGGYLVVDVDDLDAAIAFAARVPSARLGAAIEIRPVLAQP
jgi:hypothetical protein